MLTKEIFKSKVKGFKMFVSVKYNMVNDSEFELHLIALDANSEFGVLELDDIVVSFCIQSINDREPLVQFMSKYNGNLELLDATFSYVKGYLVDFGELPDSIFFLWFFYIFYFKGDPMLLILIGGISTAFNYLILLYKFKNKYYKSFIFDLSTFIILNILFLGTIQGMSIAMVASAIISILTLPHKLPKFNFNKPTISIKLPDINAFKPLIGSIIGIVIVLLSIALVA